MGDKKKNSVLVVDDERVNISALNVILGGEYKVYASSSGAEALETVLEFAPDLILLDVMMAGSVPIYLGHPATRNHIPPECYIDRDAFANEAALYEFIKTMPDETYRGYLCAIGGFLSTDASRAFSFSGFVETVLENMDV